MRLKEIRTLFFKKRKDKSTFLILDTRSAFEFPSCLMNLSLESVCLNQNPTKMHLLCLIGLFLTFLNMRVPHSQSLIFEDTGSFVWENIPQSRSRDCIPLALFSTSLYPYVYCKLIGSGAWSESECFVCFAFICT